MHILILTSVPYLPVDNPLLGIFQHHQAQALQRAGYQVGILEVPSMRSLKYFIEGIRKRSAGVWISHDNDIPVFHYQGWYWIPYSQQLQQQQWLQSLVPPFKAYVARYGRPDIIHAHSVRAGALAVAIKKRWEIPYVLTEHNSHYARGLLRPADQKRIRLAFSYADKRLVVSPKLGYDLENVVGEYVRPWLWMPNILDSLFEEAIPRQNSNLPKAEKFVFLNIGHLEEVKGQADLLQAFANEFKGKSDVQLRIGGEGTLHQKLEEFAIELGIGKQVAFLGRLTREQTLAEMQRCDTYVHASHYETFGVVLIEAFACGKPVITTACGGPEYIVNETNGVLVPSQNSKQLGKAMATMIKQINNYDSTAIRRDCIVNYGHNTITKRLSSIYHEVLLSTHN